MLFEENQRYGLRAINAHLPERPELFEDAADRLDAAECALRTVNAAMLHAGTKGCLRDGTAQRRLREAYFIAIVTPSIKHLRKELSEIEQGRGCMRHWRTFEPL